jgi:PAS domain S-box-containing protein
VNVDADVTRLREELDAAKGEVASLVAELEATSHGLIAMHAELEQARQAESRLAAVVQSSDDAMYSFTLSLVIETWNAGAEQLFGYRAAEAVGQPIDLIVPDDALEFFRAMIGRVGAGEPVETYETHRSRKDGSLVPVAVTTSAMRDATGAVVGFSAVARDITHRLIAEEQLAVARADQEVLAEQERIARDLHDHVIQRIFAAGMVAQATAARTEQPDVKERLERIVDDLDETITDIRTTIFAITAGPKTGASIRAQILEVASAARDALGFAPTVRFHGPVDTAVPDAVPPHALAVVREGLSNVAKHAHATDVVVSVTVGKDFVIEIADDGRGVGESTRQSGVANLRERAVAFHGSFELTPRTGGGTRLVWRVPLQ